MTSAQETIDRYFPEMRWRTISLAADLDRISRGENGRAVIQDDARLRKLRQALEILVEASENRVEKIQMIFSDTTPPPARNPKSEIRNPK